MFYTLGILYTNSDSAMATLLGGGSQMHGGVQTEPYGGFVLKGGGVW